MVQGAGSIAMSLLLAVVETVQGGGRLKVTFRGGAWRMGFLGAAMEVLQGGGRLKVSW